MKEDTDFVTRLLLKILNILFMYNILGTCYGCLLGIFLLSLQDVLAVYISVIGSIKWYGFIAFGVLAFNITTMTIRKYEDPDIEKRLKYIKEIIKESNFSEQEKRTIWRETVSSIIKDFSGNTNKIELDGTTNKSATE